MVQIHVQFCRCSTFFIFTLLIEQHSVSCSVFGLLFEKKNHFDAFNFSITYIQSNWCISWSPWGFCSQKRFCVSLSSFHNFLYCDTVYNKYIESYSYNEKIWKKSKCMKRSTKSISLAALKALILELFKIICPIKITLQYYLLKSCFTY